MAAIPSDLTEAEIKKHQKAFMEPRPKSKALAESKPSSLIRRRRSQGVMCSEQYYASIECTPGWIMNTD